MRSMTGFGRALVEASFGKLVIEIQSVNRKYLDVSVSLPKEYSRFEPDLRKWVSEMVTRGQISIRVHVMARLQNMGAFLPSFEQLKQWKEGWEDLAERLGYNRSEVSLSFLTSALPAPSLADMARDEDLPFFEEAMKEALKALIAMKQTEGKALAKDIQARLQEIRQHTHSIEELVPEAISRMKKKMQEKIAEVAPSLTEGDERVLREIAIFAEKVDISEEITRFRSHIDQFQALLQEKASLGRKMDFLIQEMGREINTVGSKSLEAKIAHLVVETKAELEKIREQIQNIE